MQGFRTCDAALREMLRLEIRQMKSGNLRLPTQLRELSSNFLLILKLERLLLQREIRRQAPPAPRLGSGVALFHSKCLQTPKCYGVCFTVMTFQCPSAKLRNKE